MLGKSESRTILEQALGYSWADQTEAVLLSEDSSLTRFANSIIHQNVAETNAELRIRAVFGKKVGVAVTNNLSPDSVKQVVESAASMAMLQEENADFMSLPGPRPVPEVKAFVDRTATCGPEERARIVGVVCRKAKDKGLSAAGALETGQREIAVANSLGIFAYHPSTLASISTVIAAENSTGYADFLSSDVAAIDAEALADEAIDKALRSRNPVSVEPGEYEVILEEYAANDILDFLVETGFSALAVQEGRSFMCNKFGQAIVDGGVSIWDDGLDTSGLPIPFDFEGVPKQKVTMIDRGIARDVVYDSYTAGRVGKESTGHALPAPNPEGPMPTNMFFASGDASIEQMLRGVRRGIWVTRFWYTRTVHPLTVIVTGMTRDGSFLIENGEITQPIKNMRFTQGYLEALRNVEMIGATTKLQRSWFGGNRVPALKIAKWNFSSATEY
ncbi:MAG: TldD/PmbA family protein [Chloroflexi bacterium]|nr:TldD/PmbA family protein [Chloroflexota bacterium]